MNILVIAPHPDDEVLGMGGTIARLADEGNDVSVVIATKGWEPLFASRQIEQVRTEARSANQLLGVKSLEFLDLPVAKLNTLAKYEINGTFEKLMAQKKPEKVFLPFPGDLQNDHKQVFDASMVALNPADTQGYLREILCYETVSETHCAANICEGAFEPRVWVDISKYLPRKLEAMNEYQSQLQSSPYTRSIDAIESLAKWRGSVVGFKAAECFAVIRQYV